MSSIATGTATKCPLGEPLPELPASKPGFFVRPRAEGFVAHIAASPEALRAVRSLTGTVLEAVGVGSDAAYTAQQVLSELVGNAVAAVGPHAPLVVEVFGTMSGVAVRVHDPLPGIPTRRGVPLDSDEAESGRGLGLLDLYAPGWSIRKSPIGKQIACHIPTR
ncbi:ATP-binding protein [Streptomyces sp. NPDC049597]|uniref:ATP-binding protein n=1 Tax=Streptomyces sp. NPDC049597 TaxID=3155276 RepID=UPI003448016B